jgi:hypothetical protein
MHLDEVTWSMSAERVGGRGSSTEAGAPFLAPYELKGRARGLYAGA